jgi:phage baseplate assembly protein W
MSAEFLGTGWSFPVTIGDDGQIARAHDEDSIRDGIWLVLSTTPGERVMQPDFGCGLHDLLFGAADTTTAGLITRQVRGALVRWEPRVDVLDVSVQSQPGPATTLLIRIDYRIRATNNVFNLVYPFYLEGSAT